MKFRRTAPPIPDADALTRQDVERIEAAGAVAAVPGLEGLAPVTNEQAKGPIRSTDPLPGKKVGKPRIAKRV